MDLSKIVKYYKREDISEFIFEVSRDREFVPKYHDGSFGKRPNILMYRDELEKYARDGAVSFHLSIERWKNPMMLEKETNRSNLNKLRKNWDFIIDIDAKYFEYSRICAKLILEALEFHEINKPFIKFSGRGGWHIAIPGEAFPTKIRGKEFVAWFPDLARILAEYLMNLIGKYLEEEILNYEGNDLSEITKKTGIEFENSFDPFKVVEIDTIFISNRHLFRAPFSLNEKTWLVSLPINKKEIDDFEFNWAKPENVEIRAPFLNEEFKEDASEFVHSAISWFERKRNREEFVSKEIGYKYTTPKKAIPNDFFPPCIKNILKGLEDGRKRSLFILINFLWNVGYKWEEIEKIIWDWNKKNEEPLRESYIKSQLKWHKKLKEPYIIPNCSNENYYKDIGVCKPNEICKTIRNPLAYVMKVYGKRKWKKRKS